MEWGPPGKGKEGKKEGGERSGREGREFRTAQILVVVKGAGSYLAGMAVAIPILNVDGRRHTNNFSKYI